MHLLFWLVLIVPLLPGPHQPETFDQLKYVMILNNTFLIVLFYLNAYYLYPRFYKKAGILKYTASIILTVVLCIAISAFAQERWAPVQGPGDPRRPRGPMPLPVYIFIIGISFSYRLISDQNLEDRKRKEQETENLKTELNFLRSQISPHFLFNILNTMVAMARKKSDLMEPSLIQLSTLMRYVLQESNFNRVPLQKELEYLRTYVELQCLRFGDDLNVRMDIPDYLGALTIEPMLLIPFVENAFKHGTGNQSTPYMSISLKLDEDLSTLAFRVQNPVNVSPGRKDESHGIGLKNVSRRLQLLYNNKHTLHTGEKNNVFTADLKIQFS